ncbi:hypothetical protein [Pseudomonas sp. A34-9]|uniref:hypothetical protein n=1 Tax=Pseudomonas sp. A34-9 TaxID=3034675 RepID=UPI00240DBC98|nr:hypothetical protein [Pseudomonas sp. A34-9]
MNEPVIHAMQSLVRNGDFNEGLSAWTHKGAVGLGAEYYENVFTNYMELGVGGSATQAVVMPLTPAANASYELTFLCELRPGGSWTGEPGWLRIVKGSDVLMSIELKYAASRHLEQDQARLAAGQPLELKPIAYQESLDQLAFGSGETLSFQVSGPASDPSDKRSVICITRINLQLKLEPLKLQNVCLDEEVLSPGQTLYLCLGASFGAAPGNRPLDSAHQLSFVPEAGNAWLGTGIALTSPGNPLEAVKAEPDWGGVQALTSSWLLDCPVIGEEKSYDFSINMINQYHAEPYSIDVSLGHHRLDLREAQEAAYYPVLEYEQGVRLGVQVISFYTGQALDGRTVNWTTPGQGVLGAGVTDEQGWVYFDFAPSAAGDVVITASVDSPYYASGVVTREFAVKVLATDPWKALRAVTETQETAWEATGYPNRGSDHPVIARLPADSPLRGTDLALHWRGLGHEQLGVTVDPSLEEPLPYAGGDVAWTLTSEDRLDGRFELSLVCSKLLLPSPVKPMSLARNRVRIADVREANKSPVVEDKEEVLLRLQVVHDTSRGEGDGVIDALVEWQTLDGQFSSRTGAGGWASLLYPPTHVGDQTVTARVRAHEGAVAIEREFAVKAIARSTWKDQVTITLADNMPVHQSGIVCFRGESHTLRVEALPGSTLIGKSITLEWRKADPGIGLVPGDLGVPKVLREGQILSWTLASDLAQSTSSMFELRLTTAGLEDRELFGRLLSRDFNDEVSVVLDQLPSSRGQALYPCLGAIHRYILRPHALSPLVGDSVILHWNGDQPGKLGITLDPSENTVQRLGDDGATWTLDCSRSTEPGHFQLYVRSFYGSTDENAVSLAHNKVRIKTSRESAVDPVVGQDPAWMWLQVVSQFTGQAVGQVPVKWTVDDITEVANTAGDGWSGFPYVPATGGEKTVEARVISAYDGFEELRSMLVKALASDPWDGLTTLLDGRAIEESAGFPRRKGQHRFKVSAEADSALIGHDLLLGMTGTGPGELGIRFDPPALGLARHFSVEGLSYDFAVGDLQDGNFGFCFASPRLARLSPVRAMSVGQGTQVVKIADRQRLHQTLLWGDTLSEQITVVSTITGKPMVGVTVTWRSADVGVKTSVSNFYGVATLDFLPTIPGAFVLTATVGDELHSESLSLPFVVNEPRRIKALVSEHPVGDPGQEVSADAWVVSAITGEPLAGVEVMWEYGNKRLAPTSTGTDGKATARFTLEASGQALLLASVKGGLAGWDVQSLAFSVVESRHAAVESVVASVNPVPLDSIVTMTAQIVGRDSREPMANRSILVSIHGGPFVVTSTDYKGQYSTYWKAMDLSDVISLTVKVENSDGSSDSGAVYVSVER